MPRRKSLKKQWQEGFTDLQIEKIRSALYGLLLKYSTNGRYVSLLEVAGEIEDSFKDSKTDLPVPKGEKPDYHYRIKQERLRQFMAGRPINDAETLSDIKNYLSKEGVLNEKAFTSPDDTLEFLDVHRFMAKVDSRAQQNIDRLSRKAISITKIYDLQTTITMDIQIHPSKLYARVTECFVEDISQHRTEFSEQANKKDGGVRMTPVRRGYAFVSTRENLLHILLRGEDPSDRVNYVEVQHGWSIGREGGDLALIRIGGYRKHPSRSEGIEKFTSDLGIFTFRSPEKNEKEKDGEVA